MYGGGTTYTSLAVELSEGATEQIAVMEAADLRVTNVVSYDAEHGMNINVEVELAGQITEMPSWRDDREIAYTAPEGTDARAIEEKIRAEIAEESLFERDVRRLVLGKPQVNTLTEHIEGSEDRPQSITKWFSLDEIIRVPDPIIRAPV